MNGTHEIPKNLLGPLVGIERQVEDAARVVGALTALRGLRDGGLVVGMNPLQYVATYRGLLQELAAIAIEEGGAK